MNRLADTCENITFPPLLLQAVKISLANSEKLRLSNKKIDFDVGSNATVLIDFGDRVDDWTAEFPINSSSIFFQMKI